MKREKKYENKTGEWKKEGMAGLEERLAVDRSVFSWLWRLSAS
jgi:hypothetical protein